MRKSILALAAVAVVVMLAGCSDKAAGREKLRGTGVCRMCELSNIEIQGADLKEANLTRALMCNATMPDGTVNKTDCRF